MIHFPAQQILETLHQPFNNLYYNSPIKPPILHNIIHEITIFHIAHDDDISFYALSIFHNYIWIRSVL